MHCTAHPALLNQVPLASSGCSGTRFMSTFRSILRESFHYYARPNKILLINGSTLIVDVREREACGASKLNKHTCNMHGWMEEEMPESLSLFRLLPLDYYKQMFLCCLFLFIAEESPPFSQRRTTTSLSKLNPNIQLETLFSLKFRSLSFIILAICLLSENI